MIAFLAGDNHYYKDNKRTFKKMDQNLPIPIHMYALLNPLK